MVDIARAAAAGVVLVEPASSLRHCAPFKSEPREGLSAAERASFDQHRARGRALARAGDHAAAVTAFESAREIDPRHAGLAYDLADSLNALGRYDAALVAYRTARDEDVCPLRALTPMQAIVAEVAAARDVPLIDFPALVAAEMRARHGHPIPGEELFLDHVHPTIEGHRILALALLEELARQKIARPGTHWNDAALARVVETVESSIDAETHARALRNLAKVLAWAGKSEEAARLARRSLALLGEDAEGHFILGSRAGEEGRLEEAESHYRAALAAEPRFVKALNNLGMVLVRQGRVEEGIGAYREALEADPFHANARYNLANAYSRLGRAAEAEAQYREAVRLMPDDVDAHYNLAQLYLDGGRPESAVASLEVLLTHAPGDADARYLLGETLIGLDRFEAALGVLGPLLDAETGEADAHFQFARALEGLGRTAEAKASYREAQRRRPGWTEPAERLAALERAGPR